MYTFYKLATYERLIGTQGILKSIEKVNMRGPKGYLTVREMINREDRVF